MATSHVYNTRSPPAKTSFDALADVGTCEQTLIADLSTLCHRPFTLLQNCARSLPLLLPPPDFPAHPPGC